MLRRLTLAIALITGSAQAEDPEFLEGRTVEDCDAITAEAELEVAADGSILGPIAWSVVRLVLPDLLEVAGDPAWIEAPAGAHRDAANSDAGSRDAASRDAASSDAASRDAASRAGANRLGALGGRVVVGHDGIALGVVRRVLVSMAAGRVLALELESTAAFDGSSARVVLPWEHLESSGSTLVARGDTDWVRVAIREPRA